MTTFTELTQQVHSINDLILSNMTSGNKNYSEEALEFNKHLLTTKSWFSRISWANKKRFLLALIEDTKSVWALSLLLKSIWNCRPKDAVISVSQSRVWSSYDQVPMDHNRTALPLATLKEVMTNDRKWFLSLEPESQATLLSELLMISGGPIMWEVLRRTQTIYDTYLEQQLRDLQECNVVTEPASEKMKPPSEPTKKDHSAQRKPSANATNASNETGKQSPGQAQKELDAALAAWNANMKSIRDRMKLEEFEMVFSDGTKKKLWKVNRPKPEAMETVDIIQLLPSELGKRILMNLPMTQLSDCARVNKYWSYLVDELRSELTTRQKINIELEKLKDTIKRHDVNLCLLMRPEFQDFDMNISSSTTGYSKTTKSQTMARFRDRPNFHSFRNSLEKKKYLRMVGQKPIRNLADLDERLERRGAADENLWNWCENILNDNKPKFGIQTLKETEGLLSMELESEITFPCPLMKYIPSVPLNLPLVMDPVQSAPINNAVNISGGNVQNKNHKKNKHYSLWSINMSGLFPVCKLPSYRFPF